MNERLASVGKVCSAVAHGIRNPLAAMTSSAQLALEFGACDDSTKLRLQDVLAEGKRLDARITRLLDFARGGAGVRQPFNVRETVEQTCHEIRPTMEERGIELEQKFANGDLVAYGDSEFFAQSLIELLSNSKERLHVTRTWPPPDR